MISGGCLCGAVRYQSDGLPLWSVLLPWPCSNDVYEQQMQEARTGLIEKNRVRDEILDL